jgi:hypothetical protein
MPKNTARRYSKARDRRVWVFSQLNHELQPEQIARILVAASLAQAQREADARRAADEDPGDEGTGGKEGER